MNRVAIITGSSGGIGEALVKTYLKDNYFVIGLDRSLPKEGLDIVDVEKLISLNVDLLQFSKDEKYRVGILELIRANLPENITAIALINNAAEQILKPVTDIQWLDWEQSLAVNCVAPFFLAQGLIEELKVSHGHVVNISSIHAKLTKPKFTCYSTSKAALDGVTRSLALELSPLGISVNGIAPGAISTAMLKAGFDKYSKKLKDLESFHPSKSIGTPEQLAVFVKLITDQKSGFLTGAILDFNGGIGARLYDPD